MGYAVMWVAAERRVRVLDFVPPVPASFPAHRFASRQDLARGPMSVGLPGNLAGWAELSRRYGNLAWRDLLEPATRIADRGFALAEYGAHEIAVHVGGIRALPLLWPDWAANYRFADGVGFGQRVYQPALAATLRQIAEHGAGCFYRGGLGEAMVHHLGRLGGCLTMADLASVRANWVEPAACRYGDAVVYLPPPPCVLAPPS